jgi:hypothetical protein
MLALAHGISGMVVAVSGRHGPKTELVIVCCETGAFPWDTIMAGVSRVPPGWLNLRIVCLQMALVFPSL